MPCVIPEYHDVPNPVRPVGRVLFIGVSYYNNFYLSRELRKLGWKADVLFSVGDGAEGFTHGHDFLLRDFLHEPDLRIPADSPRFAADVQRFQKLARGESSRVERLARAALDFIGATSHRRKLAGEWEGFCQTCRQRFPAELTPLLRLHQDYDIVHYTGVNSIRFLFYLNPNRFGCMPVGWDVQLLRLLGKKIVYSNVGCLDGVSQTAFRQWGPHCVCDICPWTKAPAVCSDATNLAWGRLRNDCTDYQITLGGNRVDCNADARVHEVPEFYCLDPQVWRPDLAVPAEFRQPPAAAGTVRLFHAVGNYRERTTAENVNIKCTHLYVPAVEELQRRGSPVELMFVEGVHSGNMRFHQVQADIHLDMLTFGWFGATAREMMMLGKPVVCYLRPEWLTSVAREIPEYVRELPIVQATPETILEVLQDLVANPAKREEIGRRSRAFAVKWHSSAAGARRLAEIYGRLLHARKGLAA